MTRERLEAILRKGDARACVRFFQGASEAERQAVAGLAHDWLREQLKQAIIQEGNVFRTNPLLDAAEVAVQAACSLGQLRKLGRQALPHRDLAYAVMADRRPAWLDDWAEMVMDLHPHYWPSVRRLVREGLCRRPDSVNYTLGLLDVSSRFDRDQSVRTALLKDPELLQEDVWRLFEVEGNGEFSLAAHDKYRPLARWETALVEMAKRGELPRDRLLDASLDALERDYAQFRAGWFSRFHEALTPTPDERAARAGRYLGLLTSKIPPTVSFALKSLATLEKAGRLPAKEVVDHVGPALTARARGTVEAALKLLDRAARAEPALRGDAARAATAALAHESAEVQSAALDLIERHGDRKDAALATRLQEAAPGLAASQRPRLAAWLGAAPAADAEKGADSPEIEELLRRAAKLDRGTARLAGVPAAVAAVRAGHTEVPALEFDGTEFPRLDPGRALRPIEDLDELIDRCAAVLEDAGDPDEVERVLDGVSRLCDVRPDDFAARTAPLLKRARDLQKRRLGSGPFVGCGPQPDLCGLVLAWAGGEVRVPSRCKPPRPEPDHRWYEYAIGKVVSSFIRPRKPNLSEFLSQRVLTVARRAAEGRAAGLLSAPTHAGGWIDPVVLSGRAVALPPDQEGALHDQVLALLRLAPDRRKAALARARKADGEFGLALRHALGETGVQVGPTAALWAAAARARTPFADDDAVERRHPGLGPDAGRAARFTPRVKSRSQGKYSFHDLELEVEPTVPRSVPGEMASVLPHASPDRLLDRGGTADDLRWLFTVWPLNREPGFALGSLALAGNLDWWEAEWANRTWLEPLLDPDVPLRPMALLLLALGLAAREPGEHGLATDALIAAIDDGRLDGPRLGGVLAWLLPTGLVKAARWAKTLGEAARISPWHAHVVAGDIEAALRGDPAAAPRDLHALLDLLHELLTESGRGLADAAARDYLGRLGASGKTGKLVARLLKREDRPDPALSRAVAARALEGRVTRAERWAACRGAK